jgi:hypothetical protein
MTIITRTMLAASLLLGMMLMPAYSAVPNFEEGRLVGASGIDIGGVLYDVTLVDGACNKIFTECGASSGESFLFKTDSEAEAASIALYQQIILPNYYERDPETSIFGCGSVFFCYLVTPYAIEARVSARAVLTSSPNAIPSTPVFVNLDASEDFFVFVVWTRASSGGDSVLISNLAAAPNPVAVQATVSVTATATGSANIESAAWTLNGTIGTGTSGAMEPADGTFDTSTEGLFASLTAPYEAGVYELCVNATDVAGNTSDNECISLTVYDPSAGFVTGGGWIWSRAGALTADPSVSGRANFGFVSRYRKGANVPDGNTQFVFQAGDLNFSSTTYDWLLVSGNSVARFKGAGTVKGMAAPTGELYQFMIWAGDRDPDTFRIRIWYEEEEEVVVYDNGMDQPIEGGQIIIHAGKSGGGKK